MTSFPSKEVFVWVYVTALNRGGVRPQLKSEACGRDQLFRAGACSDLAEEPLGSSQVPEVGGPWKECSQMYQRGQQCS